LTPRGLFAEELFRTPRQTEGPFYPNQLPLDTDNPTRDPNPTAPSRTPTARALAGS